MAMPQKSLERSEANVYVRLAQSSGNAKKDCCRLVMSLIHLFVRAAVMTLLVLCASAFHFADDEPRTPDAPVAFRLNDPKLIPEGIAFDPASRRFFIGSVAQHKIVVTDGKNEPRDFSSPSDKLDAVLGLTVDADRGLLYAVS